MRVLNLGCGNDIKKGGGWLNVDWIDGPDVDEVIDFDTMSALPWADGTVDGFYMSHVIEHLSRPLWVVQECWRVAKPGAKLVIRVPHGASDDAWEDQTHRRAYFPGSFYAFSQPYYWKAYAGYDGDWQVERLILHLTEDAKWKQDQGGDIYDAVANQRNVVTEMVAELVAVKPARARLLELREEVEVEYK